MARDEARRQKQLAKKKAKREDKRSHLARLHSPDTTTRLANAGSWPIEEALVPENLWIKGLGQLLIARQQPNGRLACGVFLVDTHCLGVKSAFWREYPKSDYQEFRYDLGKFGRLERVTPEYFAKLILDAAAYARALGFMPHNDFRLARLLLAGIDASQSQDTFTFGKNGKPLYVAGPHESPAQARSIAHRVTQAGGDYIIPSDEALDFALDDDVITSS